MNNSEVTRRYVKICKLQHEIELQFEELHNRKKRIESALNFLSDADDAIEALLNEKEALQKQVAGGLDEAVLSALGKKEVVQSDLIKFLKNNA